jgi:serine/threonine protein kinase
MTSPPPAESPFAPGAILAEKYRIERTLGSGGMAVVLAATHVQLLEPVAIKVLHRQVLARPGALDRFLREARVAMRLRSEHVARVFDIGAMSDETPFIVMELLRGADLAAVLHERGPIPIAEAIDYVLQACQALAEAHAVGIVHRDLKPANLFLCTSVDGAPCVKVLDFGVSKLLLDESADALALTVRASSAMPAAQRHGGASESLPPPISVTLTRALLGSPLYMAPEQVQNAREVDARADVWALGVIVYELVSGKRPFPGETLDELCAQILAAPIAPLVGPNGPLPELQAALAPCFAKDRAERYPDVRAFAEAMVAFASPDGRSSFERILRITGTRGYASSSGSRSMPPLSSSAPPPVPTPPPSVRASPRSWGMVAVLAGGLLAVAVAVLARQRASPPLDTRADASLVPRCASAASCTAANGAPSRCTEDGRCARLASEDCEVLADPRALASDDTIWFGAMFPKENDRNVIMAGADLRAVDLARQDFAQMMSGFTQGDAGADTRVRPFGVIGCDDGKDAMRAARHLVDEVKVPAIIGFRSGSEVVEVGSALLVPRGVVGVASLSMSRLVTSLPHRPGQPRLLWRTTSSHAELAKAIGHVVPDFLEPRIRAAAGIGPRAPLRVAFVRDKAAGGSTFGELVFEGLRFNGKSALENGSDYRELVLDDAGEKAKHAETSRQAVKALLAFAPHVVLYAAGGDWDDDVVAPLEQAWSQAAYRPRYLFFSAMHPKLLEWMGTSRERRRRFVAIEPVSSTSTNARFVLHYNEGAEAKVTRGLAPNSSYDAFYLLAYATYALGNEPVNGLSLGRAIGRLVPPGQPIDVGPAGIFDAFSALQRGESIDLNGATGSMDFDLKTGEAPFDQALLCAGLDDAGRAADSVESGVVFRSKENRLEGTFDCP